MAQLGADPFRAARADESLKLKRRFAMPQDAAAPTPELKLDTRKTTTETIVLCTGRITSNTSPVLQSTVRPLISESKRIVLDLTDINYIDSSGIGALVSLWVATRRAHCELKLINLSQRIKELLGITNLSKVLEGDQEYFGM
jgi:anti-sigma B factor antagonist